MPQVHFPAPSIQSLVQLQVGKQANRLAGQAERLMQADPKNGIHQLMQMQCHIHGKCLAGVVSAELKLPVLELEVDS